MDLGINVLDEEDVAPPPILGISREKDYSWDFENQAHKIRIIFSVKGRDNLVPRLSNLIIERVKQKE